MVEGPSLVEAWLASIGSRNTRAAYLSDFEQYAEHCQLAGVKVLPQSLDALWQQLRGEEPPRP